MSSTLVFKLIFCDGITTFAQNYFKPVKFPGMNSNFIQIPSKLHTCTYSKQSMVNFALCLTIFQVLERSMNWRKMIIIFLPKAI